MKTSHLIVLAVFAFFSNSLIGQENDTLKQTPVQITFAYPIASNGPKSAEFSNTISWNILYGVNGAVEGFELGSLVNILQGSMTGCQIAGIANINEGITTGVQLSGVYSQSNQHVTGMQIGGVSNLLTDSLTGIQLAGVNNIATDKIRGAQISGVSNITNHDLIGFQLTGISNLASDSIIGVQISAISNVVRGKTTGVQLSGISNFSTDTVIGVQVSGIYNGSLTEVNGLQLALVNSTKNLNGFQMGLINVADSSNGVSFGLINLIKNGYQSIEITGNEVLHLGVTVKSGTKELYTIYTAGFQPNAPHIFGFGLGWGSKFEVSKKLSVSLDLTSNYINELKDFDWEINLLNRLDFTLDYHITDKFSVLAGPSFNAHVSQLKSEDNGQFTTDIAVNPFFTDAVDNTQVQMWIGGKFGLRYKF